MLPDSATVARALETRELVVVVDSFLTDTARRAHLVLPTTTLVEDDDLMGAYGNHWLGASVPVVAPPPEVKSDLEIVQLLAAEIDRRTGAADGDEGAIAPKVAGSAREWKRRLLRRVAPMGVTVERLRTGIGEKPARGRSSSSRGRSSRRRAGRCAFSRPFPRRRRKSRASPSGSSRARPSARSAPSGPGPAPAVLEATCHPDAAPGLADGAEVLLESAIGSLRARLKLDPLQRRDVVIVPKGGHFDSGTCANALVKARLTDAGEGAAYLDCRVRIRPA